MASYGHMAQVAEEAARAGAEVLVREFRAADLEAEAKDLNDFVTRADRDSEARILETLLGHFPGHRVLAEESGYRPGDDGEPEWLVDPLDGTSNFLHGLPVFCISIGARHRGQLVTAVVLDPMGGNLFTASLGGGAFWNGRPMRVSARDGLAGAFLATGYPFRARAALDLYLEAFRDVFLEANGIRRCGAAALDLAYTAAGVYDGFFELRLSPWDIAAGTLLVREAGGVVTDLDGGDASFTSGNVVAGPAGVQRQLLEVIGRCLDEARLEEVDPVRHAHAPPAAD